MEAGVGNKKLATVGVGSAVGHRDESSTVMFEAFHELVFKRLAVDAVTCLTGSGGVSSLDDEAWVW